MTPDEVKKLSVEELKEELNGDLSIESIMNYLCDKSRIGYPGCMSPDVSCVSKEALRLATAYLDDYLDILGV